LKHRRELHDMAVLVKRHRDAAQATEDAVLAEFFVEDVEMAHAVKQRDDRRLRSDRRRKRPDRIIEVECLAAQQDHVEFLVELIRLHGRRIFQGHIPVRTFDHEAITGQFRRALRAHQKRHVATGLQQPAPEIAADGAGTDHENTHL
jgi:hypothetical protein